MTNEEIRGVKVLISVDEPWNFKTPWGEKKFEGTIVDLCKVPGRSDADLKTAFLININKTFLWEGTEIKQITVSPRYHGNFLDDITERKELVVNMSAVKEMHIDKQDRLFLMACIESFAIGSITVIQ